MQFNWNDPTAIMFAIYLVAMLGIGAIGYFSTKNLSDYILGGRSLGSFVTALSAGASDMSGWLLMGLPGAIYLSGLSEAWIAVGLVVGAYLNWRFVAARLRLYTERAGNALTLARLSGQPFRGQGEPAAHPDHASHSGVLHDVLRIGRGGRRAPV